MTSDYPSQLASILDELMNRHGYNDHRLATEAGLKIDLVRDIKRRTKDPGVYKVYEIARILGTTIEYLIGKDSLSAPAPTPSVEKKGKLIDKPEDLAFFAIWDRLNSEEREFVLTAAINRLRGEGV